MRYEFDTVSPTLVFPINSCINLIVVLAMLEVYWFESEEFHVCILRRDNVSGKVGCIQPTKFFHHRATPMVELKWLLITRNF